MTNDITQNDIIGILRRKLFDHIAVLERFVGEAEVQIAEWNQDKILFDQKGIVASLS